MGDILKTVDGYKVYLVALGMAISAANVMYESAVNGNGDFNAGLTMLFEALAMAGFRSTATKIIGGK